MNQEYLDWIASLTVGNKVVYLFSGQRRVSEIVSIRDGIIELKNGLKFYLSGGRSDRHVDSFLIKVAEEEIEKVRIKQRNDSILSYLTEFFSDSMWIQRIKTDTLQQIYQLVKKDLLNAKFRQDR